MSTTSCFCIGGSKGTQPMRAPQRSWFCRFDAQFILNKRIGSWRSALLGWCSAVLEILVPLLFYLKGIFNTMSLQFVQFNFALSFNFYSWLFCDNKLEFFDVIGALCFRLRMNLCPWVLNPDWMHHLHSFLLSCYDSQCPLKTRLVPATSRYITA